MAWKELAVTSRYPEFVEELLSAAGAQAVTQRDAADTPVLEPAPGQTPLWPTTCTVGLFPADTDLADPCQLLRDSLPSDDRPHFSTREILDADWAHLWQQGVEAMSFGGRLWVRPASKPLPPAAGDDAVVVELDPGLAFGTGTHPSTALCLRWLATQDLAGCHLLDYGCGSGILAIAALKLGAATACATDIDPQALLAARDNARRNGVDARLQVCAPDALPADFRGDVIVANILASPLVALAPRLAALARPAARLALAGLLPDQEAMIRAAYAPEFTLDAPQLADGWLRMSGRRR
ncbi:MAG: 50S ribosomal protein L11 methyltransferase [Nevskiaceae bacterium]|nr:MAG: 50S ribosomal protein L11 methyltransferase [Nevskiaceae bacterium]TBR73023.1 MAG: 50S ribosomal protein L11 methyltransferase [Nevskiaceae bacterium]